MKVNNKIKRMITMWGLLIPLCLYAQATKWVYVYNDPNNANDEGLVITYGLDNNIYVGGNSGDPTYSSYVISLTADSGNFRWRTYEPPSSEVTVPVSIAYGTDGRIYVGGYFGVPQYFRSRVSCFDTSGNYVWQKVFTYYPVTYTNSMCYGDDGNIYVAVGSSLNVSPFYQAFIVISYAPDGTQRWVHNNPSNGSTTTGARDIVYGLDDYLYVCGAINSTRVVKCLNPANGNEIWRYTGTSGAFSRIVYGADGNIYTGGHGRIASLTSFGTLRWDNIIPNADQTEIVYGSDSNIYVMTDTTVSSFTSQGELRWHHNVSPVGLNSIVYGLDGNIYVAGSRKDSINDSIYIHICVISIDPSTGQQNWIFIYLPPELIDGSAHDMVFGLNGWLYLVGFGSNSSMKFDLFVMGLLPPTTSLKENTFKNIGLRIHPNPFFNHVAIKFQIPDNSLTSLKIYDPIGRIVKQWNYEILRRTEQIIWDGTDDFKQVLPPGFYFVVPEGVNLRPVKIVKMK